MPEPTEAARHDEHEDIQPSILVPDKNRDEVTEARNDRLTGETGLDIKCLHL